MAKKVDIDQVVRDRQEQLKTELADIDDRRASILEELSALKLLRGDPRLRAIFGSEAGPSGPSTRKGLPAESIGTRAAQAPLSMDEAEATDAKDAAPQATEPAAAPADSDAKQPEAPKLGLREAVFLALQQKGKALHADKLVSRVKSMGVVVRGASPRNTLVGTIYKDKRFHNEGGNVWGLAEWYSPESEDSRTD